MKMRSQNVIFFGILTVLLISLVLTILHIYHFPSPTPSSLSLLSSSTPPDTITETKEMILTSHSYNGIIYTDWIRESSHFNYLNYKSLESFLVSYPKANIEMTVIGPQAANYYKLGNLMRLNLFYFSPSSLSSSCAANISLRNTKREDTRSEHISSVISLLSKR
jgi:hypothetical protein